MANYVFIGMPGSGKSTVGNIVSQKLNMNFCDTDKIMEAKYSNTPLQRILDKLGNDKFNEFENTTLSELDVYNYCIATGGSAVYHKNGMSHLKEIATVIFLDVSLDIINDRIKNPLDRGIVFAPGETMKDLYNRRLPLYRKYADITISIESENESPEKTADLVIEQLNK